MKKNFKKDFLYNKLFPRAFKAASKKPVSRDTVVFATNDSDELTDNMRPIYDECLKRNMNVKIMARRSAKEGGIKGKLRRLKFYMDFMRCYATAGYVFLTDYFFPVYTCKPQEQTRVVQLWHACGAFKRFGYSCADKNWGMSAEELKTFPIHNTYTDVFVSSEEIAPKYAEAFNCDIGIIRPMGVPRTDVYFNEKEVQQRYDEIRKKFPQIGKRKVILYAPTFRGNKKSEAAIDDMPDIHLLKQELEEDYVLLIKFHPIMSKHLDLEGAGGFAYDVSSQISIEDALCAADLVITDYSSLIFEYALLKRPMIFYAYDLEKYEADRSFYYDYEDFVPGPIAKDTSSLIKQIKQIDNQDYADKLDEFLNKYMSACDGNSTKRICEFLFGEN